MSELDDHDLLARYAREGSEPAFASFVARYVNLVYSTARRFTSNPHYAEEVTQAVFMILARKAGGLGRGTVLSGWLYQTTRLTAANFVRGERRRQRREQEAYMQSTLNKPDAEVWEQIAPLLDDAMGALGETDRNAVVLRFFEKKTAAEIAIALKTTEAAAHKRVNRALEKLRMVFTKRGVTLSAGLIASTVSANSVHAVPGGLGASVAAGSLGKAATAASVPWLVQATLKKLFWLKLRSVSLAVLGVSLVGGGALLSYQEFDAPATEVTASRPATGLAVIKIKLLGTPGLPFKVAYSADGQPQTANGVLPNEVSFNADAFTATLNVQGPGEFGYQVYRGDLQQASAAVSRILNTRVIAIEAMKGGNGISVSGKSN